MTVEEAMEILHQHLDITDPFWWTAEGLEVLDVLDARTDERARVKR